MQSVQLVIADAVYATALREALARSGPWHVHLVDRPDPAERCVLVLDEDALNQLRLPISHPERVVLITPKDPQHLSRAWDAGIVSVVSTDDPPNTILLAIMAAALRVPKAVPAAVSGISPNPILTPAPISPEIAHSTPKRPKTH